jgi:Protein of unknown function (DUF5661)
MSLILGNSKTAQASTGCGIDGSVNYVIGILKDIDDGKEVYTDFISGQDVTDFCNLAGLSVWAGKEFTEITTVSEFGPRVVDVKEAMVILNLIKTQIDKNTFVPKYPAGTAKADQKPFDNTILKDFLPKPSGLGHLWEFQYALGVELEHGRTRGTNVTNNHPLLTGMIVMAHLSEDTLYYTRLWVMEVEGELFIERQKGRLTSVIADLAAELETAKRYLASRLAEKSINKIPA